MRARISTRFEALHHALNARAQQRIVRHRLPALRDGPNHLRRRIMLHGFERRHPQRLQRLELGFQVRAFPDALGMKLEIDPFLQAHLLDLSDVSGTRAEGQPVERVNHLLVVRELLLEHSGLVLLRIGGLSRLLPRSCHYPYATQGYRQKGSISHCFTASLLSLNASADRWFTARVDFPLDDVLED